MPWVHILQCKDSSYYVGSTPHLERRIAEHQCGEGGLYTSLRLPLRLVYSYEVTSIEEAFYLERRLKGWRRAKKEALIRGDYEALVELSKTARPSTGSGRRQGRAAHDSVNG